MGVTDYVVTRFAVLTVPAKRLQPDTKEPSQSPPRSHGRFTVAGVDGTEQGWSGTIPVYSVPIDSDA
jgi:hypothetical protein